MPNMTFMSYNTKMTSVPSFDSQGLLPAGDYELTFADLRSSPLVLGVGDAASVWDTAWRSALVDNLEVMTRQLWAVGIRDVFADGSFVEEKDHPNDIDGYFVCALEDLASGELARKLNLLDPYKIWTWAPQSRQAYRGYPKKQLPMWHRYRVELYPHVAGFFFLVAYEIRKATNLNSRRRFGSRVAMGDLAASLN
jgi:hypothetical protein